MNGSFQCSFYVFNKGGAVCCSLTTSAPLSELQNSLQDLAMTLNFLSQHALKGSHRTLNRHKDGVYTVAGRLNSLVFRHAPGDEEKKKLNHSACHGFTALASGLPPGSFLLTCRTAGPRNTPRRRVSFHVSECTTECERA